jgi:antirestriction protein
MTARIYVGTYGHYNEGSLKGDWFDLEDYADKEEFMAAVAEFHGPGDHEYMFQDIEGVPSCFFTECHIDAEFWDYMNFDADEDAKEAFTHCFGEWDEDDFSENYEGEFGSDKDFAEHMFELCGYLDQIPEHLQGYFDYEAFARDLMYDYCEHDGHYFRRF